MGGKASRDKGAAFERLLAVMFREAGFEARRGIGQARSAAEVPDVDVEGLWVEAKHRHTVSPCAAFNQATKAARGTSRTPVAITRATGGPVLVTVDFATFTTLLRDQRTLHEVTDKVAARVEAEPVAYPPDPWKDIVP